MPQYVDLRPTKPKDSLKKLIARGESKNTTPHGQKVARPHEGTTYRTASGESYRWDGPKIAEYNARLAEGEEKIAQAEAELAEAQADLELARERIDSTTEELELYAQRVEEAAETAEEARKSLADTEERLDLTEDEIEAVKNRADVISDAVSAAEERSNAASAAAADAVTQAQDAADRYETLNDKLEAALAATPGLIPDSSFEDAAQWSPAYGAEIIPSNQARNGKFMLKSDAERATNSPSHVYATSELWIPTKPGNTYRWAVWVLLDQNVPDADFFRFIYRKNEVDGGSYAVTSWRSWRSRDVGPGDWIMVSDLWECPEDVTSVRPGLQWYSREGVVLFDDFQVVDATAEAQAILAAENALKEAEKAAREAQNALTRANAAQDSANGKSTNSYTAGDPPGRGTAVGDTHYKVTSGGVVKEWWRWNGSSWVAQEMDGAVLSSLDAGKITSGYLDVAKLIKAGAISADQVLIGIGDNLIPNGDGGGAEGWDEFGRNTSSNGFNGDFPGSFWIEHKNGGMVSKQTAAFPVPGPGNYHFEAWVRTGHANNSVYFRVDTLDADGKQLSVHYPVTNHKLSQVGVWERVSGDTKIGSAGAKTRLTIWANHTQGTQAPGHTWYTGFQLRAKVGGDLIVEGDIAGRHVDAESVAGAVGRFVEVEAENVKVTAELAARVVRSMSTESKKLVVTEEAILNHTTLLGDTVAERLNVTKKLKGRDAIFDGTVDVDQLNVTGSMAAEIVRSMTTQTKELIVTEDAILKRATVIESLVTPELISEKADIKDLGAQLVTSGAVQTSTAANRGVKIDEQGLRAWDSSGRQTLNLNGSDNTIIGNLATAPDAETGIKITSRNTLSAMDLYTRIDGSTYRPHGGVWFDSPDNKVARTAMYVSASLYPTNRADDPQIILPPMQKGVVISPKLLSGGAFRFGQSEAANMPANGWLDFTVRFGDPMFNANGTTMVFVSAITANNVECAVGLGEVTASGFKATVKNVASRASGYCWIKWMAVRAG